MVWTGIFATDADVLLKAGENVDATGNTEANKNLLSLQAESYINAITRTNYSDSYSGLNADVKALLTEAASNLIAIYLISYNMAGYTSRVEAEDMLNILKVRFNECIEILKEQNTIKFVNDA